MISGMTLAICYEEGRGKRGKNRERRYKGEDERL
jgi:hypothetical protein